MRKEFIILAAGLACMLSCSKIESIQTAENSVKPEIISVPVIYEGFDYDSKSYYIESPANWTYQLESGDKLDYFKFFRGEYTGKGSATATIGETTTYINFNAASLSVGEMVYANFRQKYFNSEIGGNNDPHNILLEIPAEQTTQYETKILVDTKNCSFNVTRISLGTDEIIVKNQANVTPDNTLSFKITDFNPDLTYAVSSVPENKVSNFAIDDEGNVDMTVSFDACNNDTLLGDKTTTTTVKIYVANYPDFDNSATIPVKVSRPVVIISNKYDYSYEVGDVNTTSNLVQIATPVGEPKLIPLRDCMPSVSGGLLITNSLLQNPENIGNSIMVYMLGSAAEYRIYSTDPTYSNGEKIESVKFVSANGSCAGRYTYDLTTSSLRLTPVAEYGEDTIISDVSECDYAVPTAKADATSVYMIIAPGTYSGTMEVTTTNWIHVFPFSGKAFTRASRKPFAMNLSNSAAQHLPRETGGNNEDEDDDWGD